MIRLCAKTVFIQCLSIPQDAADRDLLAAYRDIVNDMQVNPDDYQEAVCEDASLLTRYDRLMRTSDVAAPISGDVTSGISISDSFI